MKNFDDSLGKKVLDIMTRVAHAIHKELNDAIDDAGLHQGLQQAVLTRNVELAASYLAILSGLGTVRLTMSKALELANEAGAESASAFIDRIVEMNLDSGPETVEAYLHHLHSKLQSQIAADEDEGPIVMTGPGGNA